MTSYAVIKVSQLVERYSVISGNHCIGDVVLWHGWGMSSIVWHDWVEPLRVRFNVTLVNLPGYGSAPDQEYSSDEQLFSFYQQSLPENAIHIGYSLGGMLASQFAVANPGRVKALITLASNQQFVASENYTAAMSADTFAAFSHTVTVSTGKALKRFMGLQSKGSTDEKKLLGKLKQFAQNDVVSDEGLKRSLLLLEQLNSSNFAEQKPCPSLKLFASDDVLVPSEAAQEFAETTQVRSLVVDDCAHYSLVDNADHVLSLALEFLAENKLLEPNSKIEKAAIAQSFSQAAVTYDEVALLQKQVAMRLLDNIKRRPISICLDVGCGTGLVSSALERCVDQQVVALDIAKGMLDYAKDHRSTQKTAWLCADFDYLPLQSNSVEMVFSSLAIQWCQDLPGFFRQLGRVLTADGDIYFSTLGPNTLWELREAWQGVDDYVHVNPFATEDDIRMAFTEAGLVDAGFQSEQRVLEYSSLSDFTYSLKALGAHNLNANRPKGLMGKARMKQFITRYESFRNQSGALPATYQVWYWHLKRGSDE